MMNEAARKPLTPGAHPVRVLIVDDSPLIVDMLKTMLEDVSNVEIAGTTTNGQEAVRMAVRLRPDVITMDIRMPRMDGLEATRKIMSLRPTPIVVVSSSVYSADYNVAFNAIEAGALTVIEKPKGLGMQEFEIVRSQLVDAVRTMAGVKVVSRPDAAARKDGIGPMTTLLQSYISRPLRAVAIAASTGGPPVLMHIFSNLPKDFSIPIVVVQHILPAFMHGMVEWLSSRSNLELEIASEGARLSPGKVYFAPGDCHLQVNSMGTLQLDFSDPLKGQRPSATHLFSSVAKAFGSHAVGVILTGMGDDGVDGLEAMSEAGAHIIAQDEASSVVYGMPRVAFERNVVDEVLNPDQIVMRMTKLHKHIQTLRSA